MSTLQNAKAKLPRPLFLVLLALAVGVSIFAYSKSSGGSGPPQQPPTAAKPPADTAKQAKPSQSAEGNKGPQASKQSASRTAATPKLTNGATAISPELVAALAKHKVVLLFFGTSATEDQKVKQSVDKIKGSAQSQVVVIEDSPKNIARYSPVTGTVSQAPAVVVVDKKGNAKTALGYIDYTSIQEMVHEAQN